MDKILSGATAPSQSEPGSDGISSKLSITGASLVYCQIQDTRWGSLTPLQRCSRCILLPQPTGPKSRLEFRPESVKFKSFIFFPRALGKKDHEMLHHVFERLQESRQTL